MFLRLFNNIHREDLPSFKYNKTKQQSMPIRSSKETQNDLPNISIKYDDKLAESLRRYRPAQPKQLNAISIIGHLTVTVILFQISEALCNSIINIQTFPFRYTSIFSTFQKNIRMSTYRNPERTQRCQLTNYSPEGVLMEQERIVTKSERKHVQATRKNLRSGGVYGPGHFILCK